MAEQSLEERVAALEAQVKYLSLELIIRTSKEICFCGHPRELHKPASHCRAEELLKITCHCGRYAPPEPTIRTKVPVLDATIPLRETQRTPSNINGTSESFVIRAGDGS